MVAKRHEKTQAGARGFAFFCESLRLVVAIPAAGCPHFAPLCRCVFEPLRETYPTHRWHVTDQNGTYIPRVLPHAIRAPPCKKRGVLPSDGAKRMNFDPSSRVSSFRSKSKSFGSNKLRRSQPTEQNQNSEIVERQSYFDSSSSKLADQNSRPAILGPWSFDSGPLLNPEL